MSDFLFKKKVETSDARPNNIERGQTSEKRCQHGLNPTDGLKDIVQKPNSWTLSF